VSLTVNLRNGTGHVGLDSHQEKKVSNGLHSISDTTDGRKKKEKKMKGEGKERGEGGEKPDVVFDELPK